MIGCTRKKDLKKYFYLCLAKCHLTDLRYDYGNAKIIKTEPLSLGKVVVANQCAKVATRIK